jgi:hypothetical protein
MANKRTKSKRAEGQIHAAPDLFCKANATAPCLFAARDPLDFGTDKAFHDAWQIVVEPSLEHGTQHFADKANDDVAVLDKPAGEKGIEGGADRTAGGG